MSYGFLCCGPTTVYNVVDTSEDEDSDAEAEVARVRSSTVTDREDVSGRRQPSRNEASEPPRLPSFIERFAGGFQLTFAKEIGQFEDFHHQAIMVAAVNLPSMLRRGLYLTEGNRLQDRPVDVGGAHPLGTYAMLIKDKRWDVIQQFFPRIYDGGGSRAGSGHSSGSDPTVLNLAYRETHRLPDVAGEERVAWAAEILRIDLTETGIRTLRGLDAFPQVQTLVLDGNGLPSLPDCPWVPSMETLWMCNNDVENLDELLHQVADSFPRLTSLALMGNPVWPAAKFRANQGATYSSHNREQALLSSPRAGDEAERAGGHEPMPPIGVEESREEAAYRMQVLRRLPSLKTLDCTDVSEEERARARSPGLQSIDQAGFGDLQLEHEIDGATDRESLLSTGGAGSVAHGVSRMLEEERERRSKLPDRSSLPSTWIKEAVVMDVGSSWTKMGLAGQEMPTCCFPTVVGRMDLRAYDRITGQEERVFVGNNAIDEANKRALDREMPMGRGPSPRPIHLQRPMSGGIVTDWDDMEEIWRHGIEDIMGLDSIEHPVLMADSTATPPGAREKATEILFETMSTPAMHMALQPVLALFACGPSSGLVVDVGDSGTQIAPIYDGFVLEKGVRQVQLGGSDVTRQLAALVNAKVGLMGGKEFDADDARDVLKLEALKANMCFVSENVDKDNARMELSMTKPYMLPDGTRITLGRERYRSAELLFDPATALRQEHSLQTAILDSILACERSTWGTLAQTVILTGGTTELPGLNRRLQRELTKARRAHGMKLKFTVMVPEDDHNNTVWLGGSMLASTGQLDGLWFTRAEYEEYGAGPIHAKFAA